MNYTSVRKDGRPAAWNACGGFGLVWGLFFTLMLLSACSSGPTAQGPSLQTRLQAGIDAAAQGDMKKALAEFDAAATGFNQSGDSSSQCDALTRAAHACLSLGHTDKAEAYLAQAEQTATGGNDLNRLGRIYELQGNLFHTIGKPEQAYERMEAALAIARKNDDPALAIAVYNDLGNLQGADGRYGEAIESYRAGAALAQQNHQPMRAVIALTNGAMVCIAAGDAYLPAPGIPAPRVDRDTASLSNQPIAGATRAPHQRATLVMRHDLAAETSGGDARKAEAMFAKAAGLLEEAQTMLPPGETSRDAVMVYINMGKACMDLCRRFPQQADALRRQAGESLTRALASARMHQNHRMTSYALGQLGHLHYDQGKMESAQTLTREAVYEAQRAEAPESLYRWQWQQAKILERQNRLSEAISAYQNAIDTLESIRSEFTNCYGRSRAQLRQSANELYLMYVDTLLRYSAEAQVDERQAILIRARESVEKRKLFELREYFNDDCLGTSAMHATKVDDMLSSAVVVYPIVLSDRLAIIASYPDQRDKAKKTAVSKCYVTQVDAQRMSRAAASFRRSLELKEPGVLAHAQQLYDWLIRPMAKDLERVKPDTLVFIPDGALRNIPMGALHDGSEFLIQSYAVAVTPGLVLSNPKPLKPDQMNVLAVGISAAAGGLDALPGVADELQSIAELTDADVMMDGAFSLSAFEKALKSDRYNVVHIASHGHFSDNIEESFIMAADQPMTLNDLTQYVGLYRFREQPLELLTLSACETAAGNEQAALGLAGVAVKVGARSVLATLWAVDDKAAASLVTEFYHQLGRSDVSRAMAVQRAQQKLLQAPNFSHPGYWSPFILINNWL